MLRSALWVRVLEISKRLQTTVSSYLSSWSVFTILSPYLGVWTWIWVGILDWLEGGMGHGRSWIDGWDNWVGL